MLARGLLLLLALPAWAAVPPLPPAIRQEQAEFVLVGAFESVSTEELQRHEGVVDQESRASFSVVVVEKGDAANAPAHVTWWTVHARPEGWTGHQGQSPAPPVGQSIRVFVDANGDLLVPNGWEAIAAASDAAGETAEAETAAAAADSEVTQARSLPPWRAFLRKVAQFFARFFPKRQ
ncbi:hypothetical protein M885DRAFT_546793 [Pelagophyceae sp. CCMP2097]|nr:hypothetical protein M885DRAFT_546793 [Pelagophyceae sp. CCMP2097]|mmetsp:Transcript_141/g.548  ORF Transcript_141/g.548 Transcript_141/m.548 type:complete len:178 (-) Transcript_141:139-672(-)